MILQDMVINHLGRERQKTEKSRMNSELQKRLYEMEVMPPAAVWEKLSVNIDEINADNLISKKVLDAELTPPANAWQNISIAIDT